jgi:hypothetical protein
MVLMGKINKDIVRSLRSGQKQSACAARSAQIEAKAESTRCDLGQFAGNEYQHQAARVLTQTSIYL